MKIKIKLGIAILTFAASAALADPPMSILTAVQLTVSTTTISFLHTYSSATENGIVQLQTSQRPYQFQLPGTILEGYVRRTNFDPVVSITTATKPGELASRHGTVQFYLESDLVKIKYPRPALVHTNLQNLFIPTQSIFQLAKRAGPHDGYTAYGEPFYMPSWQAALLSSEKPVYSCTLNSERRELDWVSYNKFVGENELQPICNRSSLNSAALQPLIKKGKVFGVFFPAD
jgi:hypothetical protein